MRAFWLRQLHSWHWISAALSLAGMLLFAVTGLTLNHAGSLSEGGAAVASFIPPARDREAATTGTSCSSASATNG